MLNKYYVKIENENDIIVIVLKSLLNLHDLHEQLKKMYKKSFIHIEYFNFEHKNIFDILNMKNHCVSKNVYIHII